MNFHFFPEKFRIDPGPTYNRSEMLWGDFGPSLSRFASFSVPVWVNGLNKMHWGRISRVRFRAQKRVSEGCFQFFPWCGWEVLESIGGGFGAIWGRFVSFWVF